MTIPADNPIKTAADDVLGRSVVVESLAQQILALDASEGVVVGVLGAWGSGKTSFLNLVRPHLEKACSAVLDFNPWMFSGAEQLVESFFVELSAQLKVRSSLVAVGEGLEDYGEAFSGLVWLPVVGPWIERVRGAGKIVAKILQRRRDGTGARRQKLEAALRGLKKPIVVVLDDIDRLSSSEIRDVFKLVRLTASFPNIIYMTAFDRKRVEDALAEQGVPGRDYLEKILQIAVDLPAVPESVLNRQVLAAIDATLAGVSDAGPFDERVWPDVFVEIIRPLVRNMRDVRRYAAALHGTIRYLKGQIALADVLALEAIRVFLPDVFGRLHRSIPGLTTPSGRFYGSSGDPPHLKAQIDDLLSSADSQSHVVRSMIERLFPAGQWHIEGSHYGHEWKRTWLRERRVAHEDVLSLYLERVAGEGLRAFACAEKAFKLMGDRGKLDDYLRSLEPASLQDVVSALEAYEDEFAKEHVVPTCIVLLNLLPGIPERKRGMFDFDARLAISRVVYRLLRSLADPDAVEAAVVATLPEVSSLSSKLDMISSVGYREGAGHKLVSTAAAAAVERAWRDEVRAASASRLADEHDLLRVFLLAQRDSKPDEEPPVMIEDTPELTLAVLKAGMSEVRSQAVGSRAVTRSARLAWDVLVEIFGGEDILQDRIAKLKTTEPKEPPDLLALVDKYAGGWRPPEFGDDE